jgi:hypothetical protein
MNQPGGHSFVCGPAECSLVLVVVWLVAGWLAGWLLSQQWVVGRWSCSLLWAQNAAAVVT